MRKEYTEHSKIQPCYLKREDVIDLANIIQEGFSGDYGIRVSAEIKNTKSDWNSMEDFLNYKQLPNTPRSLSIHAWYPKKTPRPLDYEQNVNVSFDELGPYCSVSGVDETWVLGKNSKLERFFEDKARRNRFKSEGMERFFKNRLVISITIGLFLVALVNMVLNTNQLYAILFSIASAYLIILYITWATSWKPIKVKVNLKDKRFFPFLGMEVKDVIFITIAILTMIITFAQLFTVP